MASTFLGHAGPAPRGGPGCFQPLRSVPARIGETRPMRAAAGSSFNDGHMRFFVLSMLRATVCGLTRRRALAQFTDDLHVAKGTTLRAPRG